MLTYLDDECAWSWLGEANMQSVFRAHIGDWVPVTVNGVARTIATRQLVRYGEIHVCARCRKDIVGTTEVVVTDHH